MIYFLPQLLEELVENDSDKARPPQCLDCTLLEHTHAVYAALTTLHKLCGCRAALFPKACQSSADCSLQCMHTFACRQQLCLQPLAVAQPPWHARLTSVHVQLERMIRRQSCVANLLSWAPALQGGLALQVTASAAATWA